MHSRIYLSPPHLSGKEINFINDALESNWVAPAGPALAEFERQIERTCAVENCVVVSSGTAAIHLALIVLGVERGDEVICSTFTFSGSCNPIIYQGATPVFVDSETSSWNMDPELLEEAIQSRIKLGKKPKAIIAVHLFGMPAQMSRIMEVAGRYEIQVIEDAAESLGSKYKNQFTGTIGDIGVFSFNGNKIITTSGGGALVSKNQHWVERSRFLSSQSRSPVPYYQHEEIGYNYQLSNISASIGLGQIGVLQQRVDRRREIFDFYVALFRDDAVSFQPEPVDCYSNRWLTTILLNVPTTTPEQLRVELEEKNIETRPLWKPMHLQPVFKNCPVYLNGVSEDLFTRGLCLPSGSNLSMQDLNFIADSLNESLKKN